MRRYLPLISLLLILIVCGAVVASDYSAAEYLTTIQVTNNSTSANSGVAVFSLNTTSMIDGGLLNATATDATMVTGTGGSDVAFMPSTNATNPWCVFISSIAGSSNINKYLYSKGATGGKYAYFPGTNGMTVNDNPSLEPSNNFTVSITAYIDMSVNGAPAGYFVNKLGVFTIWVSSSSTISADTSLTDNVIVNGITSGEHTVIATMDSSHFWLTVDGTPSANVTAVAVPNVADNWAIGGDASLCLTSCNITIGGVLKGSWKGNYAATFPDDSGNGNTATPTFRTTSTTNLIASVISQASTSEQSTPTANVTGGWTMITATPATPDNLFTEGGFGFPGGSLVRQAAIDTGHDTGLFLIAFAFIVAGVIGLGLFAITHNSRLGRQGSLLLAVLGAFGVLIFFYRTQTIPGWSLVPFGIIALFLLLWKKSPSPVD